MKVITFAFEFGGGVDFVSHDAGDGLLNVLHPFNHLGLTHDVHVLDERVVLLPERHREALTSRPDGKSSKFLFIDFHNESLFLNINVWL